MAIFSRQLLRKNRCTIFTRNMACYLDSLAPTYRAVGAPPSTEGPRILLSRDLASSTSDKQLAKHYMKQTFKLLMQLYRFSISRGDRCNKGLYATSGSVTRSDKSCLKAIKFHPSWPNQVQPKPNGSATTRFEIKFLTDDPATLWLNSAMENEKA